MLSIVGGAVGEFSMLRILDIIHNALFGVAKDRRGGVATFLAATIIPLVAFTGLAVDTARGYLMKSRLSYALDAAALAGGRVFSDAAVRDATIQRFFAANFPNGYMGSTIDGPHIIADDVNKTINLDATASMGTSLMRIVGVGSMDVGASSQVTLSSRNIEVSLIVDITGSMGGSKITDLKSAATDLINTVVQDQQTPFYSKAALIPFSMGVNLGTYASQIRGAIPAGLSITGATRANPVQITTASAHGFTNGQKVYIKNVSGMSQINNKIFSVANVTTNTFTLRNESNTSNINGSSYSSYSSGGNVWCAQSGCEYFRFSNVNGGLTTFQVSSCASERIGAEAYTDVAPSTAPVGLNYPASDNPCPSVQIVPLTSNKTTLNTEISNLGVGGSTAGQIGIAWGWYMLSPNFGYLWPNAENVPAAYDDPELVKVAVFMTDGDFNTIYSSGVIAQDSTSGSYSSDNNRIAQNGDNGQDSFTQAQNICSAMKTAKIEIYTIGFEVGSSSNVVNFLSDCATDTSHAYLAADGSELQTVFHTIAENISRLRLSK